MSQLTQNHHAINQQQYQDKSHAYLNSHVHAQGAEFAKIQSLLTAYNLRHVLDLGCGGGHVSYQIAPMVQSVIAYDLTPEMCDLVAAEAKNRNLHNIKTMIGAAEQLAFEDDAFDAVISRFSAHHWQNISQAMQEIYRVTRPEGKVILIDILGSSNPLLNNFLQTIETIRDPSHVKNYSLSEWLFFAESIGFTVETIEKQSLSLNFDSWTARMNTPPVNVQVLRTLQHRCADSIKRYYQIDNNGNFCSPMMVLVLSK